jgi:2-hydroxy-3-oxopropionate reductase
MAGNLLRAGFPLIVHSRSPGPVDALVAAGAGRGDSPRAVAAAADVVITMLPDTPDVEAVAGGPDGLLAAARHGLLVVDMSTIDPIATRTLAVAFEAVGGRLVDAPVSGGEQAAIDGTLSIMVGGDDASVALAMPLFEVLGSTITHVGGSGAGQLTKAANQLVVGMTIQAVAEALALAEAAGVDPIKVRQALLGGFASSRILEVHGQRMIDRTFKPGFRVRLHRKDARIIESTARSLGLEQLVFEAVLARLERLVDAGDGELDHSALYLLAGRAGRSAGESGGSAGEVARDG